MPDESENIKQMRERIEEQNEQIKELTTQNRNHLLGTAGVPEKARPRVLRMLDGEEGVDWTDPSTITTVLEESGINFGTEATTSTVDDSGDDNETQAAQARIGELRKSSVAPKGGEPDIKDQIAEAESTGDHSRAIALKSVQMLKAGGL